jgi:hypothetical protein
MKFDWTQYKELACELTGNPGSASLEAKQRCAISRAYYAAFCKAREHLIEVEGMQSLRNRTNDVHTYIADQFSCKPKDAYTKSRNRVFINLNRLRTDRVRADYQDEFVGLASSSALAISLSEQVIQELQNL